MEGTELIPATGELVPIYNGPAPYSGASTLQITPDETKALREPFADDMVEIRPDGLLYIPQTRIRARLNDVLGIGQWAIVQNEVHKDENFMYFDGSLYIRGVFVARAAGEAQKHSNNDAQSWAAVYESAKSDCIVRCCKDLSIASELWEPSYGRKWQSERALKVWCDGGDRPMPKRGFYWRRKDSEPFWWESKQTKKPAPKQEPKQTPNPATPGEYIMPEGNHKGQQLQNIPIDTLEKALKYYTESNTRPELCEAIRSILADNLFGETK